MKQCVRVRVFIWSTGERNWCSFPPGWGKVVDDVVMFHHILNQKLVSLMKKIVWGL